ncbi:probable serine/threonine-protein kinase mkcB isoform X2 [Asparagus officinalis]|uniref:probable serine/threonine-protein kinase mkcB isoform X2 n=1 Tax=Asparagus officinalis TaxID=4686 RepID=UPI00098E59CD|nr:probable serine/threonine-protein kinase mkcB isoform X2 [Asparagus officinalis]
MEGEIPGSYVQRTPQVHVVSGNSSSERNLHNVSIRTGEEFSMEFLQDRVTPKEAQIRPGFDPGYMNRVGYNGYPNFQASCEDVTSVNNLRRLDSDCSSDVSNVSSSSFAKGLKRSNSKECLHSMGRNPSTNGDKLTENSAEESCGSCYQHHTHGCGISDSSNSSKLKFICSFGGKILPRPGDGKLRYVGGEKRIISISTRLSLRELMQKTLSICNQPHTIKYQLPGEDLDALISVSSDEDLQHMIEEYYGLQKADGSQRIRIFLVSLNDSEGSSLDPIILQNNSEYQFVVAVNNVPDTNTRNGYQLDGSSSYRRDCSFPQGDMIEGFGAQNQTDMLAYNTGSQFPFNANLGQKKESKHSRKQSFEDHMVQNYHQVRDLPSLNQIERELGGNFSYEKPIIQDRGFHSEMIRRQQEDSLSWVSGSNDSFHPHQGIPHAYSDSLLQEQGKDASMETSTSHLDFTTSRNIDFSNPPTLPNEIQGIETKVSQVSPQVSEFSHRPESHRRSGDVNSSMGVKESILAQDKNLYANKTNFVPDTADKYIYMNHQPADTRGGHLSSLELEALESSVSASPFTAPNSSSTTSKEYPFGCQLDQSTSQIHNEGNIDLMAFPPSKGVDQNRAKNFYVVENSIDLTYTPSSDPISFTPGIMSRNLKNGKEQGISSSMNSDPFCIIYDPPSFAMFQNPEKVEGSRGEISLLDQDIYTYTNSNIGDPRHENSEYVSNTHDRIPIEAEMIVEDVTDNVPPEIPASELIIPHVIDDPDEDDDQKLDSVCEDGDEGDTDDSITDPVTAEIEAGLYGLQIIKNADLEELRELGAGTFGTVYYGKWRGTDVAIKRIKKSCFAGRTSEQERLTKDFWREAQILSKLHHPNVVAFYGVVPDGTGGTLATVTEFMVNGSLRHVLLKKERILDRRKRLIIAMDAAFGMEYLHSKNIVHFDLKCDNLLVNLRDSHRPICKVGDFGLSRIKRNTLVSGGVRGTLPWMAPELLNGSSNRVSEKEES